MKYYFITGERSGDLHASNLAKSILERDPDAEFRGIGGDHLAQVGASFLFRYNYLSFMGFFDTIIRLRRFLNALRDVKQDIVSYNADVVIFVDFAAFNMRIVPFVNQQGIRSYYYISPKVWAWNTGRAKKIKRLVRNMFVILPFEVDFYKGFDYTVQYVGNPVKDAISAFTPKKLGEDFEVPLDRKVVALLPGSRKQEVLKSLYEFQHIVRARKGIHFLVAAVQNLNTDLYAVIGQEPNVTIIPERNYDVLSASDAAIVTSGTATLETALLKVPQVVVYKTGAFNWAIGSRLIKVDFVSLVNLIAQREVVKEMIQDDFNSEDVGVELDKLLFDEEYIALMKDGYNEIDEILGDFSPSKVIANKISEDGV